MRSNQWELEEAEKALCDFIKTGDRTYLGLGLRYLDKALECVRCMYCHEPLITNTLELGDKLFSRHFKGYIHDECREKYSGRGDYLAQHPEEKSLVHEN